jgi:choline dehydrogenase-like flavoprotein
VYHLTYTCRIGSVVDLQLRLLGTERLRIAEASIMPNVVSGNTTPALIMIGGKAADRVAAVHALRLAEFVGENPERWSPIA